MISIKTIIIVISLILLIFFNVYIQKKKLSDEKFFIQKEKDKLEKDLENSKKQQDIVYEQMKANLKKEKELAEFSEIINRKFYEVSNISPEEAREIVFKEEKSKIIDELNYFTSSKLKELKRLFQKKTINLLCNSFEKYVSDLSFSKTVNSIYVNDEIASKIIGKDGRNIKFFRKITGTDVIIKNTEKSNHFSKKNNNNLENKDFLQNILVEISCFDPQRREIAIQTLNRLVELGSKITPIYIEETFKQVTYDIEEIDLGTAEKVLEELRISNVASGMMKYIGRLKYRTSYGQNVLEHSIEVAKISGNIASELNLDVEIAKRAGFFHDIGKAYEDFVGYSHITSGVMIAKKYNESEIIINAIASHHDRTLADNPYSLIISAADTLSAARPGARSNQSENYITRMRELEKIGETIEGVKKMYSFQAGREIWVIVDPNKVSDFQCIEILRNVRISIQETVIIPGDMTISLIREKKIVERIINSGRNLEIKNGKKKKK